MGMLELILGDLSLLGLAGFLLGGLVTAYFFRYVYEELRVRRLGGHAPVRKSYVPFGLDLLYEALTAGIKHSTLEFWRDGFARSSHMANPWTSEAYIGGRRLILTADVENIKAVLATQFQDYGKGEQFNKDWHEFLGDSIFSTDGTLWHDSRQLIRPQFVKDRLSDIKIFERHCQLLLPLMAGDGRTVDVADLFFKLTLDAATDFLLGKSVDSLVDGDEMGFAKAFNDIQRVQAMIARSGPLNWLIPRQKFKKSIKILNQFCEQYIDATLRLSPAELEKTTKNAEGYTFLHALAGYTRDRTVLRDQLVAILLAGRDTTACTLSWLFYELSLQPRIVEKLRKEILATVGQTQEPSYENLKAMKYLQHCISETLRIYPIVPFNIRLALRDTTLPRGAGPDGLSPIGVLKGTPIAYSSLLMQRRKDLYPPTSTGFPEVEKFVPERWETWTPKPWTYIPFNGGPRLCVGQQFALTELAYTVTRILQRFERVESRMAGPPKLQSDIVLQPAGGVQVAFFAASC